MIRLILGMLVITALATGCKKPTCESALEHGIELARTDPAVPAELKEKFGRDRAGELAKGVATCKENNAPEAALQCMMDSTTFAAFRECDRSKGR